MNLAEAAQGNGVLSKVKQQNCFVKSGPFSVEIRECKMQLSQLISACCDVTAIPLSSVISQKVSQASISDHEYLLIIIVQLLV